MRILILSSEFPPGPGGIGTHAFQLARCFSDRGNPVLALSPQDYASEAEVADFNRLLTFPIEKLPGGKNAIAKMINRSKLLRKAVRDFSPDVVLVSGGRSIWLAALNLLGRQIPWVAVGHGTEFGTRFDLASMITRAACNQAAAIVCVSSYTRERMASLGVTRPKTTLIHNGADARFFRELQSAPRADFRKASAVEDQFVLLTVGHVSPRKGQELVIRALPEILKKHPKVVYWMAGLPAMRAELEQLALSLGVLDRIRFWGRVDQETLLQLYNACDLFLLTSQQLSNGDFEGYGIAVIEAALCGKASVVSDNSGLAEAVEHGKTGLHVPQGDVGQIAAAVSRLISSEGFLQQLAEEACQRALKEHTWEQVADAYLRFFEQLGAGS